VQRLTDYQDAAYAARYQSLLTEVRAAERRVAGQEGAFSLAVARHFAKLMLVKDEYEVARLYEQPGLQGQAGRRVRRHDRPAFPPGAAAVRAARPGHGPPAQARVRPLDG
jgi:hypothetical protein